MTGESDQPAETRTLIYHSLATHKDTAIGAGRTLSQYQVILHLKCRLNTAWSDCGHAQCFFPPDSAKLLLCIEQVGEEEEETTHHRKTTYAAGVESQGLDISIDSGFQCGCRTAKCPVCRKLTSEGKAGCGAA